MIYVYPEENPLLFCFCLSTPVVFTKKAVNNLNRMYICGFLFSQKFPLIEDFLSNPIDFIEYESVHVEYNHTLSKSR